MPRAPGGREGIRGAGTPDCMDDTETIERDGRRWWIRRAAAAPLLADGWPIERPERLTVVKRGHRRTVCRCEAGGEGFFVKAYAAGDLLRRLRARLGLGPGRREWDALARARAAGLDVPEPVALARGAEEILITREIPGGRRLDEHLFENYFEPLPDEPPYPGARPPELVAIFRRRRETPAGTIAPHELAYALADLVARLAEADLYLADLHPGNLLVSGGPGGWRLSLVDLASAEHPAPPEAILKHLVQLEHFFEPISSTAARLRCLGRLRELLGEVPGARLVARATAAYRRDFYRRRDRRTCRESKYFRRIAGGAWRGWATADWADAVQALLAEKGPGTFFADGACGTAGLSGRVDAPGTPPRPDKPAVPHELLKEGRTSTVWRIAIDGGRSLIAKRHNRARERGLVRGVLGPSRSMAAFRRGHALLARGIATARPAAAVDRRGGGRVRDTLVMTEAVAGEPLSDWLRRGPPAAERRRVVRELARMIRRMHDAGFSHRDLKAPNILISPAGGQPVLVDLDGLRERAAVSAGRRARDLMRLSVSLDEWGVARQADRLRFLRTYLGRRGCMGAITVRRRRRGDRRPARRLRRWWRKIARLSQRKAAALRRKGALTM